MCRSRSQAFSLVELLTVVALISTLAALSVPALSGLARGSRLTAGGNAAADLASFARQNALSKRCLTALVVASAGEENGLPRNILCAMQLRPGQTSWEAVTPWQHLPEGVGVDLDGSESFLQSAPVSSVLNEATYRGKAVSCLGYQIFSPDGTVHAGTSGSISLPPTLRLVDRNASPANHYEITLNPYTGQVRVNRP